MKPTCPIELAKYYFTVEMQWRLEASLHAPTPRSNQKSNWSGTRAESKPKHYLLSENQPMRGICSPHRPIAETIAPDPTLLRVPQSVGGMREQCLERVQLF